MCDSQRERRPIGLTGRVARERLARTAGPPMERMLMAPQYTSRHRHERQEQILTPLTEEEEIHFHAVDLGRIHQDILYMIGHRPIGPMWHIPGSLRINMTIVAAEFDLFRRQSDFSPPAINSADVNAAIEWNEAVDGSLQIGRGGPYLRLIVSGPGGRPVSGVDANERVREAMTDRHFRQMFRFGMRLRRREQRGAEITEAFLAGVDIATAIAPFVPLILRSAIRLIRFVGRAVAPVRKLLRRFGEIIRRLPVLWARIRSRPPLRFPVRVLAGTTAAQLRALLRRIWNEFATIQELHGMRHNPTVEGVRRVLYDFARRAQLQVVEREAFAIHVETRLRPGETFDPTGINPGDPVNPARINYMRIQGNSIWVDQQILQHPQVLFNETRHMVCTEYVFGVRGGTAYPLPGPMPERATFPPIRGLAEGMHPPDLLEHMINEGLAVLRTLE